MDLRDAVPADARTISALAIQVFLDTYATDGVRPDLAAEAFAEYSAERFRARIDEPCRSFALAWIADALVGFAEFREGEVPLPAGDGAGAELVRLYVQPRFQRRGVGRTLLAEVERRAAARGVRRLWFTVWEGNERALAFYRARGYEDVGATTYEFQGRIYGNRVLTRATGG